MRSIFMSKRKHSKKFKLRLLKEHAENGVSFYQLEKDNNLSVGMVRHWFAAYRAYGEVGLICSNSMLCRYSAELKHRVVEEYVAGGISTLDLAHKYGLRAENTVSK